MSAGNWVQQVTLGWLMFDMTQNALLVGSLMGVRAVPFLVSSPLAGVMADRVDRRKLLMLNQFFIGVVALIFAFVVALELTQVWHLFLFTFLSGAGWSFNNPVRQALVANSVPRRGLMNAIALNSMGFNINRVIGPALGGLLIAFFGPATNFFIQSACFLGVILLVTPMKVSPMAVTASRREPLLSNFKDGLKYVSNEPTTLGLISMAFIPSVFLMPFVTGLMPVFSEEVLQAGPEGLGFLLAALGVGGFLGAFTLATFSNVRRRGILLIAAAVFAGLLMMVFAQTRVTSLSLATLVFLGAAHMLYMTTNNTLLQTITPDQFRGRVMGIYMLNFGMRPLGGLIAGALAHAYGSPVAIVTGGIVTIALILAFGLRFKAVRQVGIRTVTAA